MQLQAIYCFPIKSVGSGNRLSRSSVEPAGLADDRRWMLVDANGRFVSQREHPNLALLDVSVASGNLLVTAPDGDRLQVAAGSSSGAAQVTVWKDQCKGLTHGDEVNEWFSRFLAAPVQLVRYDTSAPRRLDPAHAQAGDTVSFADGYPVLLISQASLDDLNRRLEAPVPMVSFRPNLVVSGCEAYAEDSWSKLRIGQVEFDAVKRCKRCVLTTVDPATGSRRPSGEPLKTLSQYRRGERGIFFGMNLIPRSTGTVEIGDEVEVLG